jgi:hypothetical protein
MRILSFFYIFLLLLVCHASAQAQTSPRVATFEEVCLAGQGKQEFVREWAAQRHLATVDGVDARKTYTGTPDAGHAWWMQVNGTFIIIAYRVLTSTCAIFSSAADSAQMQDYIHQLPGKLAGQWPTSVALPDRTESGPFGQRYGRAILFSRLPQPGTMLITSIFNEKPGGTYQGTLQMGLSVENK